MGFSTGLGCCFELHKICLVWRGRFSWSNRDYWGVQTGVLGVPAYSKGIRGYLAPPEGLADPYHGHLRRLRPTLPIACVPGLSRVQEPEPPSQGRANLTLRIYRMNIRWRGPQQSLSDSARIPFLDKKEDTS